MSSVSLVTGPIHLGLDVHKDSITAAVLLPGEESPSVDKIFHDEPSVRRLINRFPDRSVLRSCYEAGPPGSGCIGCSPRWRWPVMWSRRR